MYWPMQTTKKVLALLLAAVLALGTFAMTASAVGDTLQATPAQLTLTVGENGTVVIKDGVLGNAADDNVIPGLNSEIHANQATSLTIGNGHSIRILEEGSIKMDPGGRVSFFPDPSNTAVVTAVPDEGYSFAGWYNGETLYSADAALAYQNISENMTLTAEFTVKMPNDNMDNMSVSIDDQIALNLLLDLGKRAKTTSDVSVMLNGEPYAVEGAAYPDGGEGIYNFPVVMAPAQIDDPIVVTIAGDAQPLTTSVKDYCTTLSSDPAYASYVKERALAQAILNYGQAANDVFAYTAQTIADISGMDKDAVQSASVTFTDGTGKVTGASFMALTKPEFRFYTANIDEQTAYDYNQAGVTATMANGGDTLNARFVKKADGKVLLEVTGVSAENIDKTVTVTVTGLGTISFNGNAFAKAMASSSNTAQQNLGAALYNYGAAAKKCFTAEKIVDLGTLDGDYEAQDGDVLTGTLAGDYKITVADGANVTLKDANVTCLTKDAEFAAITPLGDAAITIEGTNTVKGGDEEYPGIYVPKNKTLTIDGAGSLKADSGGYSCGIGGGDQISAGNIVINGSTITADGGESAAGIGSGYLGECGSITINGGTVTAYGGFESAGIGSGVEADCGDITISGGTVTAEGGYRAVGIGSGEDGSCDNITISGGTVTAKATERSGYPAIGSSADASCGNILIKNTVTAVYLLPSGGQDQVAAIGAAEGGTCGTVTIEDGANVIRN